jgi:hypothetical protein
VTLLAAAIACGVLLSRGSFDSPGALALLVVLTVPGALVDLCVLAAWRRRAHDDDSDEA